MLAGSLVLLAVCLTRTRASRPGDGARVSCSVVCVTCWNEHRRWWVICLHSCLSIRQICQTYSAADNLQKTICLHSHVHLAP